MTSAQLRRLIEGGEDSLLEFRQASVADRQLTQDLVAFLNVEGGTVLLGVEDDGRVSGVSRDGMKEWVANLCRDKIEPPVTPVLSWAREASPGRDVLDVLAIRVARGPDKPYARLHQGRKTCYIRVGELSEEVSREELDRMFPPSRRRRYCMSPVPGAGLEAFDRRRLREYFRRVRNGSIPPESDLNAWKTLLANTRFMTVSAGHRVATVNGILLFGRKPHRYVPHSGIRAVRYHGVGPDAATRTEEDLRGPFVPLGTSSTGIRRGLVEKAVDFVRPNTRPGGRAEDDGRGDHPAYPEDVVRETVVNALVHRDYSMAGAEIMLAVYSDRLEIVSPGPLPNGVTVDGIRSGFRFARNQTLVNVMRDHGRFGAHRTGVQRTIIPGMRAHNGTEPDLIAEGHRFTVRLWRRDPGSRHESGAIRKTRATVSASRGVRWNGLLP